MRILIIEDDKDLAQLTKLALEKENFTVDMCLDGAEGLYYMQENMYDLVLLDCMLPSMDGTQVLKEARQSNISTPVIFLTALGELQDKVNGLNCGADDYMVKPFAFEELLARIHSIMRRPGKWGDLNLLKLGDIAFDPECGRLTKGAKECTLSGRESALLEVFLRNPGQVLPRNLLLSRIWGMESDVEEGNLDNYIHFLRRRLNECPLPPHARRVLPVAHVHAAANKQLRLFAPERNRRALRHLRVQTGEILRQRDRHAAQRFVQRVDRAHIQRHARVHGNSAEQTFHRPHGIFIVLFGRVAVGMRKTQLRRPNARVIAERAKDADVRDRVAVELQCQNGSILLIERNQIQKIRLSGIATGHSVLSLRPVHAEQQDVRQIPLPVRPRPVCVLRCEYIRIKAPFQRADGFHCVLPLEPVSDGSNAQQNARVYDRQPEQNQRDSNARRPPAAAPIPVSPPFLQSRSVLPFTQGQSVQSQARSESFFR